DLRPALSVPFPRVTRTPCCSPSAKENRSTTRGVVGHRVKRTRTRADVLNLRPVLTIPLPCLAEQQTVVERVTSKQDNPSSIRVVCHGVARAWFGPDVLLLGPQYPCHVVPPRKLDVKRNDRLF